MGITASHGGGPGDGDDLERQQPQYRYPPVAGGMYFGSQFTMGGQEFPAMTPESFLFGEMNDLNFLARMPGMLPQIPANIRHTNTVRSLVHVHKNSLRLRRHANQSGPLDTYHLEFTFDADVPCDITLIMFAQEYVDKNGRPRYRSIDERLSSPTIRYDPGLNQSFRHPEFSMSNLQDHAQHLFYGQGDPLIYPLVILLEAAPSAAGAPSDPTDAHHSHATLATFDQSSPDGPYSIKPLIQKVNMGQLSYILKEIYGIEQKLEGEGTDDLADDDDDNTECVVCMSEARDTMVLPCRHLCLCNACAEVLRYQANKCPICRAPFHSLLQLRVAKPIDPQNPPDEETDDDGAPPGFTLVPVVEAFRTPQQSAAAAAAAAAVASPEAAAASPRDSVGYLQVGVEAQSAEASDDEGSATASATANANANAGPKAGRLTRIEVNPTYAAAAPAQRRLPISDADSDDTSAQQQGEAGVDISLPGTPMQSRSDRVANARPDTADSTVTASGIDAAVSFNKL